MEFDINKPSRVQICAKFESCMTGISSVNALNLPHALATLFDSEIARIDDIQNVKVEKIGEINNDEVDAF